MKRETLGELIANAVSHGIGVVLAATALVVLAIHTSTPLETFGVAVFTISMMLLYAASTFYHAFPDSMRRVVAVFKRLDHSGVYLLIAGTYTPFVILLSPNALGAALLATLWSFAALGITLKAVWIKRFPVAHLALYLLMGWSVLLIWNDVRPSIEGLAFVFLLSGGLSYTAGVGFYVSRFRYAHFIWHLFVIAGSFLHFASLYVLL